MDSYEQLVGFIRTVSSASPVTHFIVHARKCYLKGLNPHQNRWVGGLVLSQYRWVGGQAGGCPASLSLNRNPASWPPP